MRVMKIPVQNSSSGTRITKIRNDVELALQEFCNQRLLAAKLVGPTFTYRFNLSSPGHRTADRSEIKKGLVKLKELFRRDIEKSVPYVVHAREPLLNIQNRQTFIITLVSWADRAGITYNAFRQLNSTGRADLVRESTFGKLMERYQRYLQFLCLKYAVPFQITPQYEIQLSNEDRIKAESFETSESEANFVPEFHMIVKLCVEPVYWLPNGIVGNNHPGATIAEVIRGALQNNSESEFFRTYHWRSYYISNGRPAHTSNIKDISSYWMAERIFLFIDPIRRVLKTLSRKTSYVPSAFSIRTAEDS